MKHIETIKQKLQKLLEGFHALERLNRRRSALAYSPVHQERHMRNAEQNARDAAETNERLRRM